MTDKDDRRCVECGEEIAPGDGINFGVADKPRLWHRDCFRAVRQAGDADGR